MIRILIAAVVAAVTATATLAGTKSISLAPVHTNFGFRRKSLTDSQSKRCPDRGPKRSESGVRRPRRWSTTSRRRDRGRS